VCHITCSCSYILEFVFIIRVDGVPLYSFFGRDRSVMLKIKTVGTKGIKLIFLLRVMVYSSSVSRFVRVILKSRDVSMVQGLYRNTV